jgi:uncharacterized membrane protein YraQ (UPF0718 family)
MSTSLGNIPGIIKGIGLSSLHLFHQMSAYLMIGFLLAGLLHIFVSVEWISLHLQKRSLASIVKAVLLGIPLPLCSCGVIPAAVTLDKKGASKGSVVSFLIATPITGVDSILATYSLLGPVFALFRLIASSVTAITAGILVDLINLKGPNVAKSVGHQECHICMANGDNGHTHKFGEKLVSMFRYAFGELVGDIWKWLIIGTTIGGTIDYLIPAGLIRSYLGNSWTAMPLMLLVGIPMYVCATGSIPIAASLMLKGMSPGAALVFLLAGPATNAVTITVIMKEIGKSATLIYIATIGVMGIVFGVILNKIWYYIGETMPHVLERPWMLPHSINTISAFVLAGVIALHVISTTLRHTQK